MKEKYVKCSECGKMFNVKTDGGYYNKRFGVYTCEECSRHMDGLEGIVFSDNWMERNWKIVFGALFVFTGVVSAIKGVDVLSLAVLFVIGFGLLAWQLIPFFAERKKTEAELFTEIEQAQREADEWFAKEKLCPECGKTSKGYVCEYCGTKFSKDE